MKTAPAVTVAIPSFNQGRFLDSALSSIFSQPVSSEVIVVDAGSTDESLAVIDRWRDRLAGFRSGPDRGQAAAINEAIANGRAPLVCWLNSDDLYAPGGLSTLVEAMNTDSLTQVAYGLCLQIDSSGNPVGRAKSRTFSSRALLHGNPIPQPASIVRRSAWENVGGLDESLHLSLDYDLWWRLHRRGARFEQINVDVAKARLHEDAKSVTLAAEQYLEGKMVVRRHSGSVPLIWHIREPFSVGVRTSRTLGLLARLWRTGFR
jgi:glycosyltransferase involved in cell wall biosynthesis